VVQGGPPTTAGETEAEAQAREKVKLAIVSQLQKSGGSVQAGERGLARLVGTNRSTMKRAINGLVVAGVVAAEAGRNGTLLRLVA
jgi:DNA-binding GntR family transcriptional regulator